MESKKESGVEQGAVAKIRFLGGVENVTGSRHLLEVDGSKILVDCGIYQEREFRDRNWDAFPVPPGQIDAVFLTHAHLDHCGLLPKLVKEGFRGKIYCSEASAQIAQIVMLDSAHIMQEDAEYKRKRHAREGRKSPKPIEPLYNIEDAEIACGHFSPMKYDQVFKVGENIEVTLHDAGHILGSSVIKMKVPINGQQRIIVFSGDVGREGRPILRDPAIIDEADYVLIESTYGDRVHETLENTKQTLCDAINDTKERGGNVIVPSFAIERSQEVMYYINELLMENKIPHIMAFLDSPMAVRVTDVFKKHPELMDEETRGLLDNHDSPFEFPGLKMVRSTRESKAINHIRGTIMIIAGSGMCTGGRIKHHLVNHIGDERNTILFVGYQAVGTLGRQIVEGAKEVRILGQQFPVKADIVQALGFSAHADKNELLAWLRKLKRAPRKVFIVHGEKECAHRFEKFLTEETGWDIVVPSYQDEIILD